MGDDDAEILILGTFPGEESLEKGEYYANSTNRFWKVILTLLGEKAEPFDYEVKKEILKRNKIALWDIYEKAVRGGSTDKNIKQKKSKGNQKKIQRLKCLENSKTNIQRKLSVLKKKASNLKIICQVHLEQM